MNKVNYIRHHKNVNMKMMGDNVSSIDMALYNGLFLLWNECGFCNELSVNRQDLMMMSKIGSRNTYHKSLWTLHEKKYIKYTPSHNPLVGSKISLYRFDTTTDTSSDTTTSTSSDTSREPLYKLYKLLNNKTIKLIEDYHSFVDNNLESWLRHEKIISDEKSGSDGRIEFKDFWKAYHEISGKDKTDKIPAEKHWKKLSQKEKTLAIEKIKPYVKSINDKKYIKKARTYLSDKTFEDEFKSTKTIYGDSGVVKKRFEWDVENMTAQDLQSMDTVEYNQFNRNYPGAESKIIAAEMKRQQEEKSAL